MERERGRRGRECEKEKGEEATEEGNGERERGGEEGGNGGEGRGSSVLAGPNQCSSPAGWLKKNGQWLGVARCAATVEENGRERRRKEEWRRDEQWGRGEK